MCSPNIFHHQFDDRCAEVIVVYSKTTQSQPWVVFTAKERVSAPQPSHTPDKCQHGSSQPQTPSLTTSANSPEKVQLHLRLVLSYETATVSPRSRSSLATRSCESSNHTVCDIPAIQRVEKRWVSRSVSAQEHILHLCLKAKLLCLCIGPCG